ncbi:MAG: hypothetical protein KDD69_09975 [Bdellovibrionales bacterium]|nr:hypothetical protein [Bdellovibrionales bacterium]
MSESEQTTETDSAVEAMLVDAAARIRALRVEAAVLFLIEAHLPLRTLLHTVTLVLEPALGPIVGVSRIELLLKLLSTREHLERFAELLEEEGGNNATGRSGTTTPAFEGCGER